MTPATFALIVIGELLAVFLALHLYAAWSIRNLDAPERDPNTGSSKAGEGHRQCLERADTNHVKTRARPR